MRDNASDIHIHAPLNSAPTLLGAHTPVSSDGSEIFARGALKCDVPPLSDVLFGGGCRNKRRDFLIQSN